MALPKNRVPVKLPFGGIYTIHFEHTRAHTHTQYSNWQKPVFINLGSGILSSPQTHISRISSRSHPNPRKLGRKRDKDDKEASSKTHKMLYLKIICWTWQAKSKPLSYLSITLLHSHYFTANLWFQTRFVVSTHPFAVVGKLCKKSLWDGLKIVPV